MTTRRRQFGSVRRLPSGRWQARYRDARGQAHTAPITFVSRTDATRWLATTETDLLRGDWADPRRGRITFEEWAADWLATTVHLKPKTRASYESLLRHHVLPAFGPTPLAQLDQMQLRRFVARSVERGVGPGTVRNAFRVVSLILAAAVSAGAIRSNPAAGVKLPRSPRAEMVFLDAGQVAALAEAIGPSRDVLVTFAAYTGLRAGEIAGLRVGRIDLLRGAVDVVETIGEANGRVVVGPTKSHERRTVLLPRFLCDLLAAHLAGRAADPQALVFVSPAGEPLRHGNFYRRHFRPAVVKAGLDPATRFHDLRHTYAALLIAQGAHPKAIAEVLGHSTITVTLDRYGHLFPGLAEGLAAGLDATYRAASGARHGPANVHQIR